jgi:hypothetical protein
MCAPLGTKQDVIDVVILKDGTIKFTTPKISGANHQSADAFLKTTQDLAGGVTEVSKRTERDLSQTVQTHVKVQG